LPGHFPFICLQLDIADKIVQVLDKLRGQVFHPGVVNLCAYVDDMGSEIINGEIFERA
jgi:hypothetical protein